MSRNCRSAPRLSVADAASNALRLIAVFSLLGGAVYGTPIVSFNDVNLKDAKAGISSVKTPAEPPAAESSASVSAKFSEATSSNALADESMFTSECTSMLKVPEPQSLVVVGSGLLGMAGVLRRKLRR